MNGIIDLFSMDHSREQELISKLGQNISRLRKEKALSLRDLADLADITHANLSRIETGKSNPRYTTLIALAEALEVEPAMLVTRK